MNLRSAVPEDTAALLAIYAPIVADSHISFEEQPPSLEEMRERLRAGSARYPWLVACSADGAVVGYAYAGPHRERAGYRWSADVCVYVAAQARGTGVGRKLYTQLFALLKRQGFYNAFAGVALPNDASVALHRSMGFTDVGTYRRVGFKSGAWYDTLWLQLQLRHGNNAPSEPIPITELPGV